MSRANGNRLAHRYGLLEPHERFRAVLEAGARNDDRERERLVSTCPMVRGRFGDPAYTDRFEASADMAVAVGLQLGAQLAQARMLGAFADVAARAIRATADLAVALAADEHDAHLLHAHGEEKGDREGGDEADDAPVLRAMADMAAKLRSEAAAVYEAFSDVCRTEMRVEAETVLRAHLGEPHVAMLGLDALEGVKPDEAQLGEWHGLFQRKWRERAGPTELPIR